MPTRIIIALTAALITLNLWFGWLSWDIVLPVAMIIQMLLFTNNHWISMDERKETKEEVDDIYNDINEMLCYYDEKDAETGGNFRSMIENAVSATTMLREKGVLKDQRALALSDQLSAIREALIKEEGSD